MDVPVDADVQCADGPCGQSIDVIVNPATRQVTHVVIKEQRAPHVERLVPVDWVTEAAPNVIHLRCTGGELAKLDEFVEHELITVWPSAAFGPVPEPVEVDLKHERVPQGELVIHRGARVRATDGHVGLVDEFLVDPASEHITHLVLREGRLWSKRDVTISVSQIDRIEQDVVYLKLDKRSIENLPSVSARLRTRLG